MYVYRDFSANCFINPTLSLSTIHIAIEPKSFVQIVGLSRHVSRPSLWP